MLRARRCASSKRKACTTRSGRERTSPLGDGYDHRRDDHPLCIEPLYENAFHRANDDERAAALVYLEDWLKGRRD
jgi:hypothetical protein